MASSSPKKLWEPKYAALGLVSIALAVFLLDLLPRLIASQMEKRNQPQPMPELEIPLFKK